jgi:plasmid stabilization system protein ParE
MTILILPSARDDLFEGFHFYERQQEGVGQYFLESLFSDIESLRLYAGIHSKRFGFHRLLSERFPYAVYYDLDRKTIRVWAVLDCRRNPMAARKKLLGIRET